MDPTRTFQNDVADMVRANRDDPETASRYLHELVEVQVITPETGQAIWDDVMANTNAQERP